MQKCLVKGVSGGGSWVLKAWRGCARCHSNLLVSTNQYSVTTLLGARRPAQSVIRARLHPTNPHTRSYQDDFPPLVRFTDFPRFFKSESRPLWRAGGLLARARPVLTSDPASRQQFNQQLLPPPTPHLNAPLC